jgi:predicted signal transduction protein with EAL and GGDEF domain
MKERVKSMLSLPLWEYVFGARMNYIFVDILFFSVLLYLFFKRSKVATHLYLVAFFYAAVTLMMHLMGIVPTLDHVILFRILHMLHPFSILILTFVWTHFLSKAYIDPRIQKGITQSQLILLLLFLATGIANTVYPLMNSTAECVVCAIGCSYTLSSILSLVFLALSAAVSYHNRRSFPSYQQAHFLIIYLTLSSGLIALLLFNEESLLHIGILFMLIYNFLYARRESMGVDALTEAGSSLAFSDKLANIEHNQQHATIVVIDVEHFTLINTRYSRAAGDMLLRELAHSLRTVDHVRKIFNLGSGRFALLFDPLKQREIVRIVRQINAIGETGWDYHTNHLTCHFYIAIVNTASPISQQELLSHIDFTITELKTRRRHMVIIFNKKLKEIRARRLDVLSTIRKALIDHSRVVVHYQPVFDSLSRKIIGAEALMRLVDPELGLISPAEFIPEAEKSGLIGPLTEILTHKVGSFMQQHATKMLLYVSLNISAEDFSSLNQIKKFVSHLEEYDIDLTRIAFEFTESAISERSDQISLVFAYLKERGIHILLDDFGTGYANLQALVEMPFLGVKIDRSVVNNEYHDYQLLRHIAYLLKSLDKRVIAEGIEHERHLEVIQQSGIEFAQGFLFSRPLSETQFIEFVRLYEEP